MSVYRHGFGIRRSDGGPWEEVAIEKQLNAADAYYGFCPTSEFPDELRWLPPAGSLSSRPYDVRWTSIMLLPEFSRDHVVDWLPVVHPVIELAADSAPTYRMVVGDHPHRIHVPVPDEEKVHTRERWKLDSVLMPREVLSVRILPIDINRIPESLRSLHKK